MNKNPLPELKMGDRVSMYGLFVDSRDPYTPVIQERLIWSGVHLWYCKAFDQRLPNIWGDDGNLHIPFSSDLYKVVKDTALLLQAWNTPESELKRKQDRADSLSTLRIIARTPNNADTLAKFIPSGPTFYLSANSEDLTMDTPMFKQPENDVIVRFNSMGEVEVIIGRTLTKEQTRMFFYGTFSLHTAISDVKPISSTIPGDHVGFTFRIWNATMAQDARDSIASYARQFVAGLLPEAKQASLFEITEVNKDAGIQASMF